MGGECLRGASSGFEGERAEAEDADGCGGKWRWFGGGGGGDGGEGVADAQFIQGACDGAGSAGGVACAGGKAQVVKGADAEARQCRGGGRFGRADGWVDVEGDCVGAGDEVDASDQEREGGGRRRRVCRAAAAGDAEGAEAVEFADEQLLGARSAGAAAEQGQAEEAAAAVGRLREKAEVDGGAVGPEGGRQGAEGNGACVDCRGG